MEKGLSTPPKTSHHKQHTSCQQKKKQVVKNKTRHGSWSKQHNTRPHGAHAHPRNTWRHPPHLRKPNSGVREEGAVENLAMALATAFLGAYGNWFSPSTARNDCEDVLCVCVCKWWQQNKPARKPNTNAPNTTRPQVRHPQHNSTYTLWRVTQNATKQPQRTAVNRFALLNKAGGGEYLRHPPTTIGQQSWPKQFIT